MATLAIVGPGSVGGVVAAALYQRGGHEIVLCARRPLGQVEVALLSTTVSLDVTVLADPAEGREVDWVLVTTKAYDAAGAARWFPSLLGPATRVAILQNGVEHRERFAAWLPPERLLPVMVDVPAERPAPGRIVQRGPGRLVVPAGEHGAAFVSLFARSGLDATETADFRSEIWRKLCLNAVGAINALLLQPNGVLRDEAVGRLAVELARECLFVGRAEGAVLQDDLPESILARSRRAPADSVNSLHADRAAGRPMEVDARNGAVVRYGRKHGIPTPYNEMATILLSAAL